MESSSWLLTRRRMLSQSAPPRPDPEGLRLRRAAREFESLFLHELVKSMRSTTTILEDDEAETSSSGLMRELMDEQLARALAHAGGLGLARLLEQELARSLSDGREPARDGGESSPNTDVERADETSLEVTR